MPRRIALLVLVASLVSLPSAAARSSASHDRLVGERRAAARCRGKPATIVGTRGNDYLAGTESRDVIVGLGGNDRIKGLEGNDLICGNEGKDRLKGVAGEDVLLGGGQNDALYAAAGGRDLLFGGEGRDLLIMSDPAGGIGHGGPGDDYVWGTSGPDRLFGDGGSDHLEAYQGDDLIDGGPGADWMHFVFSRQPSTSWLARPAARTKATTPSWTSRTWRAPTRPT